MSLKKAKEHLQKALKNTDTNRENDSLYLFATEMAEYCENHKDKTIQKQSQSFEDIAYVFLSLAVSQHKPEPKPAGGEDDKS